MKTPVFFDFETALFSPGNQAPRPICLSFAFRRNGEVQSGLVVGKDMETTLEGFLDGAIAGKYVLANFSISYDLMVALEHFPRLAEKIWAAYLMGAVYCCKVREKLLDIADGTHGGERDHKGKTIAKKYNLGDIIKRHFGVDLDKETWRTGYEELEHVPLSEWPQGAIGYAVEDSEWALKLFYLQQQRAIDMRYSLPDETQQTRGDFALRLMSAWGMRTDGPAVETLAQATQKRMEELKVELQEAGLVRRKKTPKGKESKDTKAIRAMIERSWDGDGPVPRTKASDKYPDGQIKTDADTLEFCTDPISGVLHEYNGLQKSFSAFISRMREGVDYPIHAFFNILVNSGRTSCSGPNLQQQPRVPGVRECFIPVPLVKVADGKELAEYVFATCDYDSQELRSWSQVCLDLLGDSTLARKYQADPDFDPHTDFASKMLGINYTQGMERRFAGDEKLKEYRQQSKPANFGFPVGMGFKKFRKYARGYGLIIDIEGAKKLRIDWLEQWPEAKPYFDQINRIVGQSGYGTVIQIRSQRRRGFCRYTVAANTFFQGLASDASKLALWRVTYECYTGRKWDDPTKRSPLYGCRPVLFLHDEIILVAPLSYAAEAAARLEEVMVHAMEVYTPDVPVRASAAIMRRWRKGAEPVRNAAGRLIPYEDRKKAA
jgi:DNA polymerase-1